VWIEIEDCEVLFICVVFCDLSKVEGEGVPKERVVVCHIGNSLGK
jgi:hypothetical protein